MSDVFPTFLLPTTMILKQVLVCILKTTDFFINNFARLDQNIYISQYSTIK